MADESLTSGSTGGGDLGTGSSAPNLGGSTGQGGVSAGQGTGQAAPTVFDLSDDTLVRVKGQGEPVKFGDLTKRQQADYTRKTQQAENLRRQATKEQEEVRRERARLEGIAAQLAARQHGSQNAPVDPFLEELGKAEYIDGKTAVKLVQAIQAQLGTPIANAIAERDKVIKQLYTQVVRLSQQQQQIDSRFGSQDFEGKINKWLADGGYPPEAADLAKEIYLAYEGEDLDHEFPEIFARRWQQIEQIHEKRRQKKVEEARRAPMLPGRGGNGSASKPIGLKGNESAKTLADTLWDAMQAGEQT